MKLKCICGKENKYNQIFTVMDGVSLVLCEMCLDDLTKKLNDYQADKFLQDEADC